MLGATRRRALVAVLAAGLAGCVGQGTPNEYSNSVREDFVNGCVEGAGQGSGDPQQVCQCTYRALEADVPFDRFKDVNEDLTEDPGPLPDQFQAILDRCRNQEGQAN